VLAWLFLNIYKDINFLFHLITALKIYAFIMILNELENQNDSFLKNIFQRPGIFSPFSG